MAPCETQLSPLVKRQIQRMFNEDMLSIEQISLSLSLGEAVVALALNEVKSNRDKDEIKEKLSEHEDVAIATLGELAACAENEGVRGKAAVEILKFRKGAYDKRDKESSGITAAALNEIMMKAAERYNIMRKELAIDV